MAGASALGVTLPAENTVADDKSSIASELSVHRASPVPNAATTAPFYQRLAQLDFSALALDPATEAALASGALPLADAAAHALVTVPTPADGIYLGLTFPSG